MHSGGLGLLSGHAWALGSQLRSHPLLLCGTLLLSKGPDWIHHWLCVPYSCVACSRLEGGRTSGSGVAGTGNEHLSVLSFPPRLP